MGQINYHIFGVPDGFNLLSGTPDDILYYQLFYDTSRKGTELRVNRKPNGETVYSYLAYGLVACGGRAGAFFGMSVVFPDRKYCSDIKRLAELFDEVYKNVVLKDGILISHNGQVGRFRMSKFSEQKEECEKIGRILIKNIEQELQETIVTYDSTFKTGESSCAVLPLNASNELFEKSLKRYSWIALSTNYQKTAPRYPENPHPKYPITEPSEPLVVVSEEERIIELRNTEPHKDFIIKCLNGKCGAKEISRKIYEVNKDLNLLEELVTKRPSLMDLKESYFDIYKELCNALEKVKTPAPQPTPNIDVIKDDPGKKKNVHDEEFMRNLLRKVKIYVPFLILALFISVTTVMAVKNCAGKEENATAVNPIGVSTDKFDAQDFSAAIENHEFVKAYEMTNLIKDNAAQKQKCIDHVCTTYYNWMQSKINEEEKEENLNSLREDVKEIGFIDDSTRNGLLNAINTRIESIKKIKEEELNQQDDPKRQKGLKQQKEMLAEEEIILYKADSNYNKNGGRLGYTVSCKTGDTFVLQGTINKFDKDDGVEVVRCGDKKTSQIRVTKARKLTLTINDSVKIIFNVSR